MHPSLRLQEVTSQCYLGLEPGLQLLVVLGSDALVVLSDLGHHLVEVLSRSGVYFHVDLTAHLRSHRQQLLQTIGGKQRQTTNNGKQRQTTNNGKQRRTNSGRRKNSGKQRQT